MNFPIGPVDPPYRSGDIDLIEVDGSISVIYLTIHLHGKILVVCIDPYTDFDNSPARKGEFDRFATLLRGSSSDINIHGNSFPRLSQADRNRLFDWAVLPCADVLRQLAPSPLTPDNDDGDRRMANPYGHRLIISLLALNDKLCPSSPRELTFPDHGDEWRHLRHLWPVFRRQDVTVAIAWEEVVEDDDDRATECVVRPASGWAVIRDTSYDTVECQGGELDTMEVVQDRCLAGEDRW